LSLPSRTHLPSMISGSLLRCRADVQ